MELLIAIQCYKGDQGAAMELARLIADIEPEKRANAHIMFVQRFDTPVDMETVRYCAHKFGTHIFNSDRRGTGWPSGPNDLAFSAYDWFYSGVKRRRWPYKVMLLLEADCVPLTRDWIDQLLQEWNDGNQLVLGHLYNREWHQFPHINGVCMISPYFKKKVSAFIGCNAGIGWDCFFGEELIKYGRASEKIFCDYNLKTITEEELYAVKTVHPAHPLYGKELRPVLFHGVKDGSAREIVRKRLCP